AQFTREIHAIGSAGGNPAVFGGTIGLGTWAVKCGTCCPARSRGVSGISRALLEVRTLARTRPACGNYLSRIGTRHRTLRKIMADKKDDKPKGKTITLKRSVESGTVRQSFSHGRSKSVVVETVKRRTVGPGAKVEKVVAKSAPKAET